MRKSYFRLAFLVYALVMGAAFLWGQTETGAITGTLLDPTGAVVPNAKVTVRAEATGLTRGTTTNADGIYSFTNLMPGTYVVRAEAAGFSTVERRAEVTVGSRVGVDIHLEVGRAETVVQVSETVGMVNTETQTMGTVIHTQQVVELPTLTRNPYDLVATAGNVSEADPTARGTGFAINGQRAASTNVLLDGASNNDEFTASVGQSVPLDAVQEFSVLTSNFTAEFGRASGGVVNLATKAGSNSFHGTAYEFNRVSRLAANSFENNSNDIPKQTFTRNQFGYSVGGPIMREKLFFFNSTEWVRVRSQATRTVYVPTADLINASGATARQFFQTYGQRRPQLVSLGRLSRSDFQARGFNVCGTSALCQALPANLPIFERVSYARPADSGGGDPQNTYLLVGRLDWHVTNNTQIYGRYAREDGSLLSGTVADSPFVGYDTGELNINNNVLLNVVHTFSPRWVSQTKLVYNRLNNQQPLGERPPGPTLYFNPTVATAIQGTRVALPGYLPFSPGNGIPFGGPQNFGQVYEDMSLTRGSHQFRFGGSYVYIQDNRTFGAYMNPVQSLGAGVPQGMENLLKGELQRFTAAINPQGKFPCASVRAPTADCQVNLPVGFPDFSRSNRYHEFAFYGQDSWRVRPSFTLNFGLRWEYYGVQHNIDPKKDSNYYDGSGNNVWQQIRNGTVMLAPDSPIGGLWKKDWNNFAPRVGFAWDMFGDGKSSFRGGYGIGYERNFGNVTFNVIQNPPNYAVIALQSGADLPTIPIFTAVAGPLAGSTGRAPLPTVSLRNVNAEIETAYAHFWSASLERQLRENVIAAVEYSGSKGVNLYSLENVNMVGAGNVYLGDPCTKGDPESCTARLRTTQYSNNNRRGGNGFSNYHALNIRFETRNLSRSGLTLRANYTWAHAIDNLSSTFSESANNFNLGLLDPFNPKLDRGDADFDIRHRFALSALWNIPFGHGGGSSVVSRMLGGWTLAPIFTARTGSPFSMFDSSNAWYWATPRAMFNSPVARSGAGDPKALDTPNLFSFMDLSGARIDHSFVNPITGTAEFGPWPGNMTGRNAFRGPGRWNLDLGIYKNFALTETVRLQLRGELFNAFNHSNLILVPDDVDVASTDSIKVKRGYFPNGTTERRNVQLALKLIF